MVNLNNQNDIKLLVESQKFEKQGDYKKALDLLLQTETGTNDALHFTQTHNMPREHIEILKSSMGYRAYPHIAYFLESKGDFQGAQGYRRNYVRAFISDSSNGPVKFNHEELPSGNQKFIESLSVTRLAYSLGMQDEALEVFAWSRGINLENLGYKQQDILEEKMKRTLGFN